MIIYKDIITGDEILSSAYDPELVDDIMYRAECGYITEGSVSVNTGANASAEEAEEALDDGAARVMDVVNSFRLEKTEFDKKSYLTSLKAYMKSVKAALQEKGASPEEVTAFEKGAQAYVKNTLLKLDFSNLDFYTGESMNPDGMVVIIEWYDDGAKSRLLVWKHGVSEMKV
ncbi:Mss4-like protein [Ilyonectria robusta]|uniref:Mss4-like protein n=1 Tax=Ilyonectria robusta TaxID=1079257 RepID=UPI001E8D9CD0|nr:Mss4-like protein [Ilyonectria robusta]KAH8669855.1 Mss4-like protein [Ilyonectria robusta]